MAAVRYKCRRAAAAAITPGGDRISNEELVLKIQAGDTSLLPDLWSQVERFIGSKANDYAANHPCIYCDDEDLKQSGFFGLLDAVNSYDPAKDCKFLTHLDWRLKPAFDAAAIGRRKRQKDVNTISLDTPIDEDGTMLYDIIEDPQAFQAFDDAERRIFNEQLHDALERLLGRINAHHADIVRQIYFNGSNDKDILKRRETSLNALRRYPDKRDLEQFLDYYVVPSKGGLRPTEETVIRREEIEKRIRRRFVG